MRPVRYSSVMLLMASALGSAVSWADDSPFDFDGEVTAAHDDNVNRASKEDEIRKDSFVGAAFNMRYGHDVSSNSGMLYSIKTAANAFSEFDKLNEFTVAGEVKYIIRPGRAFTSSTYNISAFAKERFSSSVIRDSTTLGATVQLAKSLTDVMRLDTGIGYTEEEAEGEVFDLSRWRIFANVDTLLTARWAVFLTYVYVDGDVVSTSSADIVIGRVADAIEPDDAFGGVATNQFAYRIDAVSHLATLGINYKINHHSSIDLSARYLNSTAKEESALSYDDVLLRAGYLFAF